MTATCRWRVKWTLLRSEIDDKPVAEVTDLKKESPSDSLQQGSGNSSGDLIICMNTPSDPTSQAELPEDQPQTEPVEQQLAQPADLGSLAEQLTIVTRELSTPDENGGSRLTLGRGRRGGKRKRLSLEHLGSIFEETLGEGSEIRCVRRRRASTTRSF
ncbi:hypothetical protein MRX96_033279 [Rhipicephalus microplus]